MEDQRKLTMETCLNRLKLGLGAMLMLCLLVLLPIRVQAAEGDGQGVILHTNDVHASIDNYSKLAAYRQMLINQGYDVVTVDAGDAIQGQSIGALTEGSAIAELMNSVPYDLAVPGNHEFDYGMSTFLNLAQDKKTYPSYQYICCNFVDLKTGKTVFPAYAIKKIAGHSVAFVGIDTPESYTKSTPKYFQDANGNYIYSFCENDLYERVQNAVNAARAEGAEYVIAVGHLGLAGVTENWTSKAVVAATTGIDAIIDGHDHETYTDTYTNKDGKTVVHAETGYSFKNIGQLKLTFSANGLSIEPSLVAADSVKVDANSAENVRDIYGKVEKLIADDHAKTAYLEEKIGTSQVDMPTLDADGQWIARYEETALGDYVADAYRTVLKADIAFVNGGGVRGSGINKGDITRKNMEDVNPWRNEMGVIKVTGEQIQNYLEFTSDTAWDEKTGHLAPDGSFVQPSGLSYEINLSGGASPVVTDDKGAFKSFDPSKKRRVRNVRVNGKAIDPKATYTVAGSLYVLKDCVEADAFFKNAPLTKSDLKDADILVAYLTDGLKDRTITSAQYGRPAGRILIQTKDSAEKTAEAMYRLYNANSGEHFYTSSWGERKVLIAAGWKDEGTGWYAPKSGKPVYRLYNKNGGEHLFTMSNGERKSLVKAGWKDEGIACYSADKAEQGAVPVYRQYNPKAFANNHNYTTSVGERRNLTEKAGWKDEGIAWYGVGMKAA